MVLLLLAFSLPVLAQEAKKEKTSSKPAPQVLDGQFEITVVEIEKVHEWKMFPSDPNSPAVKARDGKGLVLVKFNVKNIKDGKEDTDQGFKGFEVEDQEGNTYKSYIGDTDLREVPFGVPTGTRLKTFRISGLTFDIEKLAAPKAQ